MRNLYEAGDAQQIRDRIWRLHPDNAPLWGLMTASQALSHCATSIEWAVGDRIPPRAFFASLLGRAIKSKVLGGDTPFRRNSPTSPDLLVKHDCDFMGERVRLLGLIDRYVSAGPERCTPHPHSFFGRMTPQEWAILTYKHLDHHLRQFGV
jgi:hypothetical protein